MLALWEHRLEAWPPETGRFRSPQSPTQCLSQNEGKCGRVVRGLASLHHPPAVAWSPSCPWDPVSLISETQILTQTLSSSQGLS